MTKQINLQAEIQQDQTGMRLDQAISILFSNYSRMRLKEWILKGYVCVDSLPVLSPREKVFATQLVTIDAILDEQTFDKAEQIELNIVYEDEHVLIINKQAGLVVHPGAGNREGTLLNALLYHCPDIEHLPRAGIVHRLDKDTTGLMIVAKTLEAHTNLVADLQAREIVREYEAVCQGMMTAGGVVNAPIARHPTKRTNMAVRVGGRESVTHYRVAEKFRATTRLRLRLETGRTHQIRVHMTFIKHPLVGDPVYCTRPRPTKGMIAEHFEVIKNFKRQALHAAKLELIHPITKEKLIFDADLPNDMQILIQALRADLKLHGPDLC